MSQNLNLLRQKYCRTVTVTGKRSNYLFPLEKECDEGKALTSRKHQKRFFTFKSSIHAVFNRPIETKQPVENYRSLPSSTSKVTIN